MRLFKKHIALLILLAFPFLFAGQNYYMCGASYCSFYHIVTGYTNTANSIFSEFSSVYSYAGIDDYTPQVDTEICEIQFYVTTVVGNPSSYHYKVSVWTKNGMSLDSLLCQSSNEIIISTVGWQTGVFEIPCRLLSGTNYAITIDHDGSPNSSNYIILSAPINYSSTGSSATWDINKTRSFVDSTKQISFKFKSRQMHTVAYNGLMIGDSTSSIYLGQNAINYYLYPLLSTSLISNIAIPAQTIAQQEAVWDIDLYKTQYDWISIMIGLNDLNPAEAASTAINRLQTLINHINADKKATAKIVILTTTPCRSRLISLYGEEGGEIAYQKWLDINNAIMGNGGSPITGVDIRTNGHTSALNDGSGNLLGAYDVGDGVHENNAARQIIAEYIKIALTSIGF